MTNEEAERFIEGQRRSHPGRSDEALLKMTSRWSSTGDSPGQLGQMREGSVEACVSSPPYEKPEGHPSLGSVNKDEWGSDGRDIVSRRGLTAQYGDNQPDNFWSASRTILEQVFLAVKPGGHAVFVVKDYVRKGKRVPFADHWRQLCEAVGFRTLHCHRAWLVEDNGTQGRTDGGEQRLTRERKSFFRRLAERKGAPRIDWETVWCLERP